jgi:hypothetical protein
MRKLPISPRLALAALALCALAAATPLDARTPKASRYPLRVHILASDRTGRGERMRPGEAVACDSIEDMVSSVDPNPDGPVSFIGFSGDPCALHAGIVAGRLLEIQNNDFVYSGEGRADLVTPPSGTRGFSFQYRDCGRIRVFPGFQSLPARWKKPGATLEVLLPSDEVPVHGRPLPPSRCTLTVTVHPFVYLLLRNGELVEVSEDAYWKHPAMRAFLRGNPETVQQRVRDFTVPAHPAR